MMSRHKKLKIAINCVQNTLYVVLSIFILLCIWQVVAVSVDNELLLPTFGQAVSDLYSTLGQGDFYISLAYSLLRTFISFSLAVLLAVLFYALSKSCKFANIFVLSLVSTLRSVPTIALILFLVILTNSQIAPTVICILVVMPIIFAGLQGVQVKDSVKNMCKIYSIKGIKYFKYAYFPVITNTLVPVLASSIALNLKIMVASEVLAHTYMSLGGMMQSASVYFEMGQLLALAFITVILAIILEKLITLLKFVRFKVR